MQESKSVNVASQGFQEFLKHLDIKGEDKTRDIQCWAAFTNQ